MAEQWQLPDKLHQRFDLFSNNCSRQTGFSRCDHHGNSNRGEVSTGSSLLSKYGKVCELHRMQGFTLLPLHSDISPNIPHLGFLGSTYWRQPHYHSNDLNRSHMSTLVDFLLPGGILTLLHPFCSDDLSRSHTYTTGLPIAWEHIDIASFIIVPKTSVGVPPIPLASYSLGTHWYCFIHYRSKDLSCSHAYPLPYQRPQPQSHQWLILHQNPPPQLVVLIHNIVNFPQVIVLHSIRVFVPYMFSVCVYVTRTNRLNYMLRPQQNCNRIPQSIFYLNIPLFQYTYITTSNLINACR